MTMPAMICFRAAKFASWIEAASVSACSAMFSRREISALMACPRARAARRPRKVLRRRVRRRTSLSLPASSRAGGPSQTPRRGRARGGR